MNWHPPTLNTSLMGDGEVGPLERWEVRRLYRLLLIEMGVLVLGVAIMVAVVVYLLQQSW